MDARQLHYFLAVVDHGGVTRAAEALHIAQPSISQSIRALERELGGELFHRVGRGMELSDAGRAFVSPARAIVGELAAAMDAVRATRELAGGELELAVTEDLSVDPLVPLIAAFRARYADVRVVVRAAAESDDAARLVRDADCELALCSLPDAYAGLVQVPLATRRLVLVTPGDHADLGASVSLDQLAELPLVAGPLGDAVRNLLETRLRAIGARPRITVETTVPTAVGRLVLHGAGIGVLPARFAAGAAAQGARTYPIEPPLTLSIGILHRADVLSAPSRAFCDLALEQTATD